jgi:hypothetical protein
MKDPGRTLRRGFFLRSSAVTSLLLTVMTPEVHSSWSLAASTQQIAAADLAKLSVEHAYPGLTALTEALASRPESRLAVYLVHPDDRIASFEATFALGALITEHAYPRRVVDCRTSELKPGDLVALPQGTTIEPNHRELASTLAGRVLEVLP